MTDTSGRTTESEIAEAVLRILAEKENGQARYAQLKKEIPSRISLTTVDRTHSSTRPAEQLWEQRVRNIRSHHKASGNFINEGLITPVRGGLKITEAGRASVQKNH